MFKPNFIITPATLKYISEISEIKAIVERSRVLPLNEAQLKRQAIARMVHTSTSIEGNPLAQYEVDKVLSGMSVAADPKSVLEVKNYQLALQQIEKLAEDAATFSLEEILALHGILIKGLLPEEKTGHFRPGSVYIVDDLGDGREKLRFEGPAASKIPFLLNELLKWLKVAQTEDLHPIIISGIFHTEFVHVHPFSDGNGRMARLLTTMLLHKMAWDFRKILVLEDYYNRDRQAYYNALAMGWETKYHKGADLTSWLEYFSKGFLAEAKKVGEAIASIGFGKVSDKTTQVYVTSDEVKIMDFVTTTGRITSDDVSDVLGIAKRTSQLKLKNLVDKGLIKIEGAGPATFYTLS